MTKVIRPVLAILCAGLLAYALFLCVVPFLGYGWHIVHGDHISYGGWKIFVPKEYYVSAGPHGPNLWRLSLGAPQFEVPFAHVSFFNSPHQFRAATDYAKFEQSVTQYEKESGYQFSGMRTVLAGNTPAYCMEFRRQSKEPLSLVRCAIENSGIYGYFEGNPRFIPELFDMLKQMSSEATGAQPNFGRS